MANEISCINYRNWNRTRNNGDVITPYIVELVTNIPAKFSAWDVPHLLGVGSILALANRYSHVWGAGYLNPTVPHKGVFESTFHAVRGYKTLALLRNMGVSLPDVPVGDPGIFVHDLWRGKFQGAQTDFKAAIIPHHNSMNNPFFKQVEGNSDFIVIDILNDTLEPIDLIARSEIVISQSLHGLIFAESLGKPSVWISDRSDPIWSFKFEDWFSTTAEPPKKFEPMSKSITDLLKSARMYGTLIDKEALISAFPLSQVAGQSNPFLSFISCRKDFPISMTVDTIFSGKHYPLEDINDDILAAANAYIFPKIYHLFGNRSERTYCAVLPADETVRVDSEILESICRYLDHHSEIDYAYVLPRRELTGLPLIGGKERIFREARPGAPVAGGALVLRPDSNNLTRNFTSFYLE